MFLIGGTDTALYGFGDEDGKGKGEGEGEGESEGKREDMGEVGQGEEEEGDEAGVLYARG